MERHGKQDYFGELNEICDSLAKLHWNDSIPNVVPISTPSPTSWIFSMEDTPVSCFEMDQLYDFTYGNRISIPYWQDDRHPIPAHAIQFINWDAIGAAAKCWPRGKRQWLAKHLTKFSATGRNMFRRNKWTHDLCLRCMSPNEDSYHILHCLDITARARQTETRPNFPRNPYRPTLPPHLLDAAVCPTQVLCGRTSHPRLSSRTGPGQARLAQSDDRTHFQPMDRCTRAMVSTGCDSLEEVLCPVGKKAYRWHLGYQLGNVDAA
jgi:hypothetical protein